MSNTSLKYRSLALACAMLGLNALADDGAPMDATLTAVRGTVLVARGHTIATARTGDRLPAGTRVLTTLNGAAIVDFDGGCRVVVEPGARYVVDGCARVANTEAIGDLRVHMQAAVHR